MRKRIIPLALLAFTTCSLALAQTADSTDPSQPKPEFQFDMGIILGLESLESYSGEQEGYQKVGLYPQFSYGRWRFGFDFTFEFDGSFDLRDLDEDGRADNWNTFSDAFYKLQYVEYARKGEPIYGLIGELDSIDLGKGMLMEAFNNNLFYPYILQRGLLFEFDGAALSFPYVGVGAVVNDVLDWDVIGARVFFKPAAGSSGPPIRNFQLGITGVVDVDPKQEYTSKDTRPPRDNPSGETVGTLGVDVQLPLIEDEKTELATSVEWAIITGKGNGFSFGIDYHYDWFTLHGQLRYLGRRFVPHYFDPFYWVERPFKYDGLDSISSNYVGYLVGADVDILNVVSLSFTWEDGLIEGIEPRIRAGVALVETAFKKIGFHITYDKKGITDVKDFADLNNSIFEALFEYRVTEFASIVFIQSQSFAPIGRSVPQTHVETRFRF
jgi:hypothetical protein